MDPLDFSADGPCVPGDDEWLRRQAVFMADSTEGWMWLSFVDTNQEYTEEGDYPGGPRFLGIALVPGGNIVQAATVAHMLGCNPGGQVSGYPIPGIPKEQYRCRLLDRDEAKMVAQLDLNELCVSDADSR